MKNNEDGQQTRKLPATSTGTTPGDGAKKKSEDVAKLHTPSAAGKGAGYRPVNLDKWSDNWAAYCRANGHRFVNRRCVYCDEFKQEDCEG